MLQGVRVDTTSARGMVQQRSDNPYKGLVSVVNYRLIRTLFRLPLGDYQNVTVYPRRLIQSVTLETESAFTNPECLLKTWWRGATFKEVPVPFVKRQRGRGTGTRPEGDRRGDRRHSLLVDAMDGAAAAQQLSTRPGRALNVVHVALLGVAALAACATPGDSALTWLLRVFGATLITICPEC